MSKTKLDNVEEKKVPSFSSVIFVFLYLIVTMGISVLWLEIPIHITLVSAAIVTTIVAMMQGYSWKEIQAAILHGCSIAMLPMLILMIIGAIIGAWISAGTIQTIIYYGLQLISPRWFLVAAALMCSITSLATGSAWTDFWNNWSCFNGDWSWSGSSSWNDCRSCSFWIVFWR